MYPINLAKTRQNLANKFSNKKAFFLVGLLAVIVCGVTYGAIGISLWFDENRLIWSFPIEVRLNAPIRIEKRFIPQAGESAAPAKNTSPSSLQFATEALVSTSIDNWNSNYLDYLIFTAFPDEKCLAKAVALAEGYRTAGCAKNKTGLDFSIGLYQVNLYAHAKKVPGTTWDEKEVWLCVPENNINFAKTIRESWGSWKAWGAFKNKTYQKYLASC
jgi:hypothetical protein